MLNTIFLWLKIRPHAARTIPRNTGLSLMLLWPASALLPSSSRIAGLRRDKPARQAAFTRTRKSRPFSLCRNRQRGIENSRKTRSGNSNFAQPFASCRIQTQAPSVAGILPAVEPGFQPGVNASSICSTGKSERIARQSTSFFRAAGRRPLGSQDGCRVQSCAGVKLHPLASQSPVCSCVTGVAWLNFGAHLLAFTTMYYYTAIERFDRDNGERWVGYTRWLGRTDLTRVVTLDSILCPPVVHVESSEDWPFVAQEEFMLDFFTNLDFVLRRVSSHRPSVVIAVARDPSAADVSDFPHPDFEFAGFDIVDAQFIASALLNGCNFPEAFDVSELSSESGSSSRGSGPSGFVTLCTGAIRTATKRNPMSGPSGVTPESPTTAPDFPRQPACQKRRAALLSDNVVEETFCIGGSAFLRPAPRGRRRDSIEGSSRRHRQNPRRKA